MIRPFQEAQCKTSRHDYLTGVYIHVVVPTVHVHVYPTFKLNTSVPNSVLIDGLINGKKHPPTTFIWSLFSRDMQEYYSALVQARGMRTPNLA